MSDKIIIAAPILSSIFITYLSGKIKSSNLWFEPPGWVFFVVWTCLYIMLGFLLYESKKQKDYISLGLIITILVLTYSWQIVYSKFKLTKLALYIIFLILFVQLFFSDIITNTKFSQGYIMIYVPFIAWILFALLLSLLGPKQIN